MSKDTRTLVGRPTWGSLRQGTIFSGGVADGYSGCDVHGMVITAHCDLTHDKVPLVNFLPVVTFADWLRRDYAGILSARLEKGALGRVKNLLEEEGHSASIMETLPLDVVLETLFPAGARGKAATRGVKARQAAAEVGLCRRCATQIPLSDSGLRELEAVDAKSASYLRKECLRDQLGGYHFLSHLDPDGPHSGFVILMRQVYHLPRALALAVAGGLDLPSQTSGALLASSGYAAPVGELQSPFLECMMQRFTLLFSRIGVPDMSPDYVRAFISEVGHRE